MSLIDLAERAILPDWLIRVGMRRLMAARLREMRRQELHQPGEAMRQSVMPGSRTRSRRRAS